MTIHDLPAVNASAQRASGVLLLIGYALIRARRIAQHRRVMIAAFVTSSLFLICYVVYHAQVGSVPLHAPGLRAAAVFHDPDHARDARRRGARRSRSSRCRAA